MKYKLINYYPPYKKKDIGKIVWFGPNNLLHPENYPEFWEPVVEKDYEILSLARLCTIKPTITDVFDYGDGYIEALLKHDKARIHSVKRLSDGEIFTIGDKLETGIIKKFYLPDVIQKEITIYVTEDDEDTYLSEAVKLKQPLFTTEDGVDIFKGDGSYGVRESDFKIVFVRHRDNTYITSNFKEFSTLPKAEEYILMNKPCLSLNDIFKDVEKMRKGLKTFENSELAKRFKKLVQQKLNK